jgi:acetoin utilization protein AcuB
VPAPAPRIASVFLDATRTLCARTTPSADSAPAARTNPHARVGNVLAQDHGMTHATIEQFMTSAPHTIGHDQSLAVAYRLMREHGIRHLPVLDGGRLAGVVSERDLLFIDKLVDVDHDRVPVSEAMSQDVYAVPPRASLLAVAQEMADHKYGSAVVMDGTRVAGVFTTVDALKALVSLLVPR